MKVVVVSSCDLLMDGEPPVINVCTEEVAKKVYGYPDNEEEYIFDKMEVKDTYTEDEVLEEE